MKISASPKNWGTRSRKKEKISILFTCYEPNQKEIKAIKSMGGQIVVDEKPIKQIDYIVSGEGGEGKAKALLYVLGYAPLVNVKWLHESIKEGRFVSPNEYSFLEEDDPLNHSKKKHELSVGGINRGLVIIVTGKTYSRNGFPSKAVAEMLAEGMGGCIKSAAVGAKSINAHSCVIVTNCPENLKARQLGLVDAGAIVLSPQEYLRMIRDCKNFHDVKKADVAAAEEEEEEAAAAATKKEETAKATKEEDSTSVTAEPPKKVDEEVKKPDPPVKDPEPPRTSPPQPAKEDDEMKDVAAAKEEEEGDNVPDHMPDLEDIEAKEDEAANEAAVEKKTAEAKASSAQEKNLLECLATIHKDPPAPSQRGTVDAKAAKATKAESISPVTIETTTTFSPSGSDSSVSQARTGTSSVEKQFLSTRVEVSKTNSKMNFKNWKKKKNLTIDTTTIPSIVDTLPSVSTSDGTVDTKLQQDPQPKILFSTKLYESPFRSLANKTVGNVNRQLFGPNGTFEIREDPLTHQREALYSDSSGKVKFKADAPHPNDKYKPSQFMKGNAGKEDFLFWNADNKAHEAGGTTIDMAPSGEPPVATRRVIFKFNHKGDLALAMYFLLYGDINKVNKGEFDKFYTNGSEYCVKKRDLGLPHNVKKAGENDMDIDPPVKKEYLEHAGKRVRPKEETHAAFGYDTCGLSQDI